MAVADQQPTVARNVHAKRSSAGVGDDRRLAAVGRDAHDAAVDQTRPELTLGVDHDILWRVTGHRNDGELGVGKVRQRVDRRWLPADGIDRRLAFFRWHAADVSA